LRRGSVGCVQNIPDSSEDFVSLLSATFVARSALEPVPET
jgi:hypothetical protein